MNPPLHAVCAADTSVQALLGEGSHIRLYPFGRSRQPNPALEIYPYAVWQIVYGTPNNYIGAVPDLDYFGTQVDCYGDSWVSARAVANALQAALEPHAHVVSYNGEWRDPETDAYRVSFTVDWHTARS